MSQESCQAKLVEAGLVQNRLFQFLQTAFDKRRLTAQYLKVKAFNKIERFFYVRLY